MKVSASLKFAKSLIFPKTEKHSSARRSFFGALICIALSIIPLIVVISISTGMINGMTERIIGLSSNHLGAYISTSYKNVQTSQEFIKLADEIKNIEGILNAYPEIQSSSLALNKNIRTGIEIRAVKNDIFSSNSAFRDFFEILDGSFSEFEKSGGKNAVIGKRIAEILDIKVGDSFRIITTRKIGERFVPKLTTFNVSAIVSSGYQELDQFWVFIPLETAYSFLSLSNSNFIISCETEDAFSPSLVRIQNNLRSFFGGYANVYRWDQIHSAEFENFSSTKVMLVFVMMLIVLVASINISSAIIMLVIERKKEIAILKSIGASPKEITLSFLITGMSCGIGGVFIGLPIGIILTIFSNQILSVLEHFMNFFVKIFYFIKKMPVSEENFVKLLNPAYYLQSIPITIPFSQILWICFFTIILSLIVSIIPSVNAGKEKPLEILRKN